MSLPPDVSDLLHINLRALDAPEIPKSQAQTLVGCLTQLLAELANLDAAGQKAVLSAVTYTLFEAAGLSSFDVACPICDT